VGNEHEEEATAHAEIVNYQIIKIRSTVISFSFSRR
jgi:hypothetical protein